MSKSENENLSEPQEANLKTVLCYIIKNKYEIMTVLLMSFIAVFNLGGFSLKPIPSIPPGYYENIAMEHAERLRILRDDYQNKRIEMKKEIASRPHTHLETAQIALKLNLAEVRYLEFWILEKPIILGMLKPFEEKKYLKWYVDLAPEIRKLLNEPVNKLHEIYPKLAECEDKAMKDYLALVKGLSKPSSESIIDAKVAGIQVITRNLSNSESSMSYKCDMAMLEYISSLQMLSGVYGSLSEAYLNYSDENEVLRKFVNALLYFALFLMCYQCRENIIKIAAKSMGA